MDIFQCTGQPLQQGMIGPQSSSEVEEYWARPADVSSLYFLHVWNLKKVGNFLKMKVVSRKPRDGSLVRFKASLPSAATKKSSVPQSQGHGNPGAVVHLHTFSSRRVLFRLPLPAPSSLELACVFGPFVLLISSSNTCHH